MMTPLALIAAIAKNDVIGDRGGLPWSYPEDRKHYLERTTGHAIIMGRRTFEETNEPRADCRNIVISSMMSPRAGVEIIPSLDLAISMAHESDPEPLVIGGARIFAEALPRITHIWLTEIPLEPNGDTKLHLDRAGFTVVSERHGESGLVFVELVRDSQPNN